MIQPLKKLIKDKERRLKRKEAPDKEIIFCLFKELIQEYFGRIGLSKVFPTNFSEKVLFVGAYNPIWLSELQANKEKIISELNKNLGGIFVKEIKIK